MNNNLRRLACWKESGNSIVVLSVAIKFATSLTRSHERQDEGHWIVIRNSGRLDTVSFCGVLVYRPRESMEKSLCETSQGNACCKLTSSSHNPLLRISQNARRQNIYPLKNKISKLNMRSIIISSQILRSISICQGL